MLGVRYDLVGDEAIFQGADWEKAFQLVDPNTKTPYDLTGCTVKAQARKVASSNDIAIAFNCSITAPEIGVFKMSLTNAETSSIAKGRYHYDAELTDTVGLVSKIITPSTVQVVEEYTRT